MKSEVKFHIVFWLCVVVFVGYFAVKFELGQRAAAQREQKGIILHVIKIDDTHYISEGPHQ